ncbi:MAG: hypothetical protein ACKVP7_05030 [Hyphomicrobiaceae bacterium]
MAKKKSAHDMGGDPAGPVDRHEHTPTLSERRVDAMMQLLRMKPRGFWTTDENRRTIESLTPDTYNASGYYEKWAYAMRGLLVEKGVLTDAAINKRLAEVKTRYGAAKPKAKAKSGSSGKAGAKPAASKPAPAAKKAAAKTPAAKSARAKSK